MQAIVLILSIVISSIGIYLVVESNNNQNSGNLIIYTSVPIEIANGIADTFEAIYPAINVSIFRSATSNVMDKIQSDLENTGKVQADIIWIADFSNSEELRHKHLLQPYASTEKDNIIQLFVENDYYYYGSRFNSMVVVYNANEVDRIPSTYHDLLSYDKVLIPDPITSGSAFFTISTFVQNEKYGWNYIEQLSTNNCTIARNNGDVIENVSNGRFQVGLALDFIARNYIAENPSTDLKYIYPEEGNVVIASPIGISVDSEKNLKNAHLFIDWILSKNTQTILSQDYGITPVRTDVPVPTGMISLKELIMLPSDANLIYENKEQTSSQFIALFPDYYS